MSHKYSLEEVSELIGEKENFWYVQSSQEEEFPPVSISLRDMEEKNGFGITVRNINEKQPVDIDFEVEPDNNTFVKAVECWMEEWQEEEEEDLE